MIAHIKGEVAEKFDSSVIVDVNGVGYEIALTALDFDAVTVGETQKFYTHQLQFELFYFVQLLAKLNSHYFQKANQIH